jgi:hypothetical protein
MSAYTGAQAPQRVAANLRVSPSRHRGIGSSTLSSPAQPSTRGETFAPRSPPGLADPVFK